MERRHGKRDPVTGHMTTGHEWNGIEELYTPVPRVVMFFLAATTLFAVGYWILMPAWPLGWTYTKGLLGIDQRDSREQSGRRGDGRARAVWTQTGSPRWTSPTIEADPTLMDDVRETGRTLFGDNCAACHGINGTGGPGFPRSHRQGLAVGRRCPKRSPRRSASASIRTNENTRVSQMMAFGRDGVLDRDKIADVVAYVRSLVRTAAGSEPSGSGCKAGQEVFAANCVACHGENGKGKQDVGAPDLTDGNWIYGGDRQSIHTTIYSGRQGHMPHWGARLSPLDIKILAPLCRSRLRERRMSDRTAAGNAATRPSRISWKLVSLTSSRRALCRWLVGANAHLVYVAIASQPDCVPHAKDDGRARHIPGGEARLLSEGERHGCDRVDPDTAVPPLCGKRAGATCPRAPRFDWLKAGWRDHGRATRLQASPMAWRFSPFRLAIVWGLFALGLDYILFPALAGFMVVGPLIAIGLYEKSRAIEAGNPVSLRADDLRQGRRRGAQVWFTGAILCLLMLLWMRAAVIIYALFFGLRPFPGLDHVAAMLFTTLERLGDAAGRHGRRRRCSPPSPSPSAPSPSRCCSTRRSTPSPPWAPASRWSGTTCR